MEIDCLRLMPPSADKRNFAFGDTAGPRQIGWPPAHLLEAFVNPPTYTILNIGS